MNFEGSESSLSRIPLRPPPASWRDSILATARAARPVSAPVVPRASILRRFLDAFSAPSVVLGCAWLFALWLHGTSLWGSGALDSQRGATGGRRPPAIDFVTASRVYQERIAALTAEGVMRRDRPVGAGSLPPVDPSRPRTDRGRGGLGTREEDDGTQGTV